MVLSVSRRADILAVVGGSCLVCLLSIRRWIVCLVRI